MELGIQRGRRVHEHPEQVGHADGGDHHREQEDHPEKAPSREVLHDEQGQSQAEQVLDGHVDGDVNERHDQRSRTAAGQDRVDDQPDKRAGDGRRQHPADESSNGEVRSARVAIEQKGEQPVDRDQHRDPDGRQRSGYPQKVGSVDAEQQLRVVREADKLQLHPALREAQARQRDIERREQRKDRESEDDQDGREDEHAAREAVEACGNRTPPGRGPQRARRRMDAHGVGILFTSSWH